MRLPQWARNVRSVFYEALARNRLRKLSATRAGRPHGLPGELVISLTSYPARFSTLHLTLACLSDQTVRADRIILWIARDDYDQLPYDVRNLSRVSGFNICLCDDLKPYKKLIPTLKRLPDAFIVTADDDLYYGRDWLQTIVDGYDGRSITCIWGVKTDWTLAKNSDSDIIPGSGAGMLVPPHSLHAMVTDQNQFETLCPVGDDIWYYFMAKKKGTRIRKVGRFKLITWLSSQRTALAHGNGPTGGGNEAMLSAMREAFPG